MMNLRIKKLLMISLILISILLSGCSFFRGIIPSLPDKGAGYTYYVPDNYSTIQAAVDAASPGDTIIVRDGTYTENVDVNKSLTIRSENGAEATIVQAADPNWYIFHITASFVTLNGFTIERAIGAVNILIESANFCNISNNTISGQHIGLYLLSSNDTIICNNKISNCTNGNIYLVYASNNLITQNEISFSSSDGIFIDHDSDGNTIDKNNISNNRFGINLDGYWLSTTPSQNTIFLNNFRNNSIADVYIYYGSSQIDNILNSRQEITYIYKGKTYTSYLGNYWSDYAGSDLNEDGIGDVCFYSWPTWSKPIIDNYPLMEPFENYVIGEAPPEKQPHIDRINPASGAPGIEATIRGMNFNDPFPFRYVSFGGQTIGEYDAIDWKDNEIILKVPPPLLGIFPEDKTVEVTVGPFPESNPVTFTYKEPFIDYIEPKFGETNTQVTINGRDFGAESGLGINTYVEFGKSSATEISWKDDEIIVKAPRDYGTGTIKKLFKLVMEVLVCIVSEGTLCPDPIEYLIDSISDLSDNRVRILPNGNMEVDITVYTAVEQSNVKVFTYGVPPLKYIHLASPAELRVYDSQGRVTGLVSGEVKEEIPNSAYFDSTVGVLPPSDSYRYQVAGTGDGTYGLTIASTEDGKAATFTATDIPTTSGAIHQYTIDWDVLSQGGEGVTVEVDFDGDGTFELTITAGSTFIFVPAAIDIDPDTLNLKSKIKWVTACVKLPGGYNVAGIDVGIVKLWYEGNNVPAEWGDIQDGTLMVKFNGKAVQDLFTGPVGAATVAVAGELQDGTRFGGNDTISVIKKP